MGLFSVSTVLTRFVNNGAIMEPSMFKETIE